MRADILCLASRVFLILVGLYAWTPAEANTPYQGLYIVVDPYSLKSTDGLAFLNTASAVSASNCTSSTPSVFCGAADGILLTINWCSFQIYGTPDPNTASQFTSVTDGRGLYPSCHYDLNLSNTGAPNQNDMSESLSSCGGTFDICAASHPGQPSSYLGTVLAVIQTINSARAALPTPLPPLKISVGLAAGVNTPQAVLDNVATVDVPHNSSTDGDTSKEVCYRLPEVWKENYINQYDTAIDTLISYIIPFVGASNITMLKQAAITTDDLELGVSNNPTLKQAPSPDPANPLYTDIATMTVDDQGLGTLLTCPPPNALISADQIWYTAYTANPVSNKTIAQAYENAFGSIVGHEMATLHNNGITNAIVSIATGDGGTGFPDIDCDMDGAGYGTEKTCNVDGSGGSSGDWGYYYFAHNVQDLFTPGALALQSAQAAYSAATGGGTLSFTASQLAINFTGLQPAPLISSNHMECWMNTGNAANTVTLNGVVSPPITPIGSSLGWQTAGQKSSCTAPANLATTLGNGLGDGGQYLELQTDYALDASCQSAMNTARSTLESSPPPAICAY